ncbi:hypothetical protein BKA70DRAFT_1290085 [Coprinopsis sp. MPI-PUGE-AT-0042]|nr:hypothetical protein BKA70DRAFT_1290085 [Coprinopsis sp. MPI-PUGE-AT-0042]
MSGSKHISGLPPEIHLHIFKHALPGPLCREGRLHFQSIRSVCTEWRILSFSSPALWSSLDVRARGTASVGDLFPSGGNPVEKWFAHAGPSIPLELRLSNLSHTRTLEKDFAALTALVIHHQSRWRSLHIIGTGTLLWDVFQRAPASGWNNLQELAVSSFQVRGNLAVSGIGILQRLKSIESVSLQVLALIVTGPEVSATSEICFIAMHTHLRTLLLHIAEGRTRASNSVIITLPCLEYLSITTPDLTLLCHLNTCSLSELEVHLMRSDREPQNTILQNFISQCTALKFIHLHDMSNGKGMEWMLPTLCAQPNITTTKITSRISPFRFNELPQSTAWWDDWCPNLRGLTVELRSKGLILEDENEMKHLTLVASLLQRRSELGRRQIGRLIFKNKHNLTDFPYDLFEALGVGRVDIMTPW